MTKEVPITNRKWQNHFKSKGFVPFMYDRLLSYSLSMPRQFQKNPFDFSCEHREDNPLAKYFFEFAEEFPYEIYIELTNKCNLNCLFCARKNMKREQGIMSFELYKKIIDEIAKKRQIAHVHIYGIGESTLDPEIIDKIKYAISKGVVNLVLFTNGKSLLENELYKKIIDTGISNIGIDMDGFSKETYEKLRVGGNFENIKNTIKLMYDYVRNKKLNARIELAYQIYEGINEHEKEMFAEWANSNNYEYKFVFMHQWAGLRKDIIIEKDESRLLKRGKPCCALWTGFMILWNGDVALCFQDADGREIAGNLNKESIDGIWRNILREKRKKHVRGQFDGICKNCKEYIYNELPECNSNIYPKELR